MNVITFIVVLIACSFLVGIIGFVCKQFMDEILIDKEILASRVEWIESMKLSVGKIFRIPEESKKNKIYVFKKADSYESQGRNNEIVGNLVYSVDELNDYDKGTHCQTFTVLGYVGSSKVENNDSVYLDVKLSNGAVGVVSLSQINRRSIVEVKATNKILLLSHPIQDPLSFIPVKQAIKV